MSENNKSSAEDKLREINAEMLELIRLEAEIMAERKKIESEKE